MIYAVKLSAWRPNSHQSTSYCSVLSPEALAKNLWRSQVIQS